MADTFPTNGCSDAAFDECPDFAGLWPPCVDAFWALKALSEGAGEGYSYVVQPFQTYIDKNGNLEPTPTNSAFACPCCDTTNLPAGIPPIPSPNPQISNYALTVNTNSLTISGLSATNFSVSGIETTACVVVNPFQQRTVTEKFLNISNMTQFGEMVAAAGGQLKTKNAAIQNQSYMDWVNSVAAGMNSNSVDAYNFTHGESAGESTWSNTFVTPYAYGSSSDVVDWTSQAWNTNLSDKAMYSGVQMTNSGQFGSDLAAQYAGLGDVFEDNPNSTTHRDENLVVNLKQLSILGVHFPDFPIDFDPLRFRIVRIVIMFFYCTSSWAVVFWGIEQKYQAFVQWLALQMAFQTEQNTQQHISLDVASDILLVSKKILTAGWIAIGIASVISLASVLWSTWHLLSDVWPAADWLIIPLAGSAGTKLGGVIAPNTPEVAGLITSFVTLLFLCTPIQTAFFTIGEVFAFRAKCAFLVTGMGKRIANWLLR